MDIPSVLFSFLEAALKPRSTAAVVEIKQVMSAKLKTHLAVHCGGRMMIGNHMFNIKFTVMRESNLQRTILFLSFKLFKIFENFKNYFWVLFI